MEKRAGEFRRKKQKSEPIRRYKNPLISVEINVPAEQPHVGPGRNWVKAVTAALVLFF